MSYNYKADKKQTEQDFIKVISDATQKTNFKEYLKECTCLSFSEWLKQGGC